MPSVSWADVAGRRSWRLRREGIRLWRLGRRCWVDVLREVVWSKRRCVAWLWVDGRDGLYVVGVFLVHGCLLLRRCMSSDEHVEKTPGPGVNTARARDERACLVSGASGVVHLASFRVYGGSVRSLGTIQEQTGRRYITSAILRSRDRKSQNPRLLPSLPASILVPCYEVRRTPVPVVSWSIPNRPSVESPYFSKVTIKHCVV